jgi:hypothetical protein
MATHGGLVFCILDMEDSAIPCHGSLLGRASASSVATMRAAFVEAASSLAWVTSASNTSTSTLPRDRSCRNTTQEEMREHGGSPRQVGKIFFFLSD